MRIPKLLETSVSRRTIRASNPGGETRALYVRRDACRRAVASCPAEKTLRILKLLETSVSRRTIRASNPGGETRALYVRRDACRRAVASCPAEKTLRILKLLETSVSRRTIRASNPGGETRALYVRRDALTLKSGGSARCAPSFYRLASKMFVCRVDRAKWFPYNGKRPACSSIG